MSELSKSLLVAHDIVRTRFLDARFQHELGAKKTGWSDWLAEDIAKAIEDAARNPEKYTNG